MTSDSSPRSRRTDLFEDETVTLVDPGLQWNCPSLSAESAETGHGVADLDRVFLTHCDVDHTGGLRALTGTFDGTRAAAHPRRTRRAGRLFGASRCRPNVTACTGVADAAAVTADSAADHADGSADAGTVRSTRFDAPS